MDEEQLKEKLNAFLIAFADAMVNARLGKAPNITTLKSKWGPLEGIRDGNVITFKIPDGREYQVELLPEGGAAITLFGREVGRLGPVEIEEE